MQPPIGAPGAMPQTSAVSSARSAAHRFSSGSYQQLYRFHPPKDGTHPYAGLLDVNGTLYGTTLRGGLSTKGTIYSISTSGAYKVLHRFRGGSDGASPLAGLIDVDGTLYGTTEYGGDSRCSKGRGCGTVYSIGTSGRERVLYAFKGGSDGAFPVADFLAENGVLYGTTGQGGGSGCTTEYTDGCGTVFSLTTSGHETVLHHFTGGSDGAYPTGDLIDVSGVIYGTTALGGSGYGSGTVYSITPSGAEKVLYAFHRSPDGSNPVGLIDVNGTLYGTTVYGGVNGCTGIGCGTVYSISTSGSEQVLYSFKGGSDGEQPQGAMIEASGLLYGTTMYGGGGSPCFGETAGCGTVFSVTSAGVETALYGFQGGTDGGFPTGGLVYLNGALYGTTSFGGDHDVCCSRAFGYGWGTVFSVSP
jgi:uncharacterized repeat protein (TIGR03803 family)